MPVILFVLLLPFADVSTNTRKFTETLHPDSPLQAQDEAGGVAVWAEPVPQGHPGPAVSLESLEAEEREALQEASALPGRRHILFLLCECHSFCCHSWKATVFMFLLLLESFHQQAPPATN